MRHEQGICPKCGSQKLTWHSSDWQDDWQYYPVQCDDCGFFFSEVFYSVYYGLQDDEGEPIGDEGYRFELTDYEVLLEMQRRKLGTPTKIGKKLLGDLLRGRIEHG